MALIRLVTSVKHVITNLVLASTWKGSAKWKATCKKRGWTWKIPALNCIENWSGNLSRAGCLRRARSSWFSGDIPPMCLEEWQKSRLNLSRLVRISSLTRWNNTKTTRGCQQGRRLSAGPAATPRVIYKFIYRRKKEQEGNGEDMQSKPFSKSTAKHQSEATRLQVNTGICLKLQVL